MLTGANGAGKSSLLRLIAGLIRPAEGAVALTGGDGELSVGEQAHYVGHLDPLKPALTVMENLTFWARFLNGGAGPGQDGAAQRSLDSRRSRRTRPICRPVTSRPGKGGGCRWRGCWRYRGRSGCSTSRPPRSTPPPRSASDGSCRTHLGGGGIIVAATHGPLGLDGCAGIAAGNQALASP